MPAPRLLPSNRELQRLVEQGLTHAEIAEHVFETTGNRVARSAVSAALSRAGLTVKDGVRYREEIPWRVKVQHLTEYPARMLRLLGRQRAGFELTGDEVSRLRSWLEHLEKENLVVAYAPDNVPGFLYVTADEVGDNENNIPIRKRIIKSEELK